MSDSLLALVVILVAAGTIGTVLYLNYRNRRRKAAEGATLTVYSDWIQYAANGARVCSRSGKSNAFLDTVNLVLNDLCLDAAAQGYTEWLTGSAYTIYVLDGCTPSPEQGVPCFKIRADNYDGTVFDQDSRPGIGYVLASEYVFRAPDGSPTGEYVICASPEHDANNIRYGAEHIILYYNDRARYLATETHISSGHPIIPPRAA